MSIFRKDRDTTHGCSKNRYVRVHVLGIKYMSDMYEYLLYVYEYMLYVYDMSNVHRNQYDVHEVSDL